MDMTNNKEPDIFWHQVKNYSNILEEKEFSELAQFALHVLSIPHSNAECERIFSKINFIKTKPRNRLITKTINGCVLASQCVKDNKLINKKIMIEKMNDKNLYPDRNKGRTSGAAADTSGRIVMDLYGELSSDSDG